MIKRTVLSLFLSSFMLFIFSCNTGTKDSVPARQGPDAPDAPGITVSDSQLTVSWNAIGNADSYQIWYSSGTDSSSAQQWGSDIAGLSDVITGLTNGTTYTAWIKAKNSNGVSDFSLPASGTPLAASSAPYAPSAPTLTSEDASLTVNWNAVSGATSYQVWFHTANNSGAATQWGSDITGTTTTITGLSNGSVYYVWLKAKNSQGTSGFSSMASATPTASTGTLSAPSAPTLTPSDGKITVIWSAVSGADSYDVWYGSTNASGSATLWSSGVSSAFANISGLTNGTVYYIWVKARNSSGTSAFSPASSATPVLINTLVVVEEAEGMTSGGSYTGTISSPFGGMALYGGSDYIQKDFNFPTVPGNYRLDIVGASNNANGAKGAVYLAGTKLGNVTFTGVSPSTQSLSFSVTTGGTGNKTVKITGEADDGSWDLYLDSVSLYYVGTSVTLPSPIVPATPVWTSGNYRNLFKEWGKTDAEIDARVDSVVQQLFYGADDEKIFYTVSGHPDMAYIWDVGNNDVRSEGVSYGMMMCVQLDMQTEFNQLWKFAKTYMQHSTGSKTGYFRWQVTTSGVEKSPQSAPDGEEYFAMALYFAWKRWGNGTGINDYQAEADNILNHMVNHRTLMGLATWNGDSENMIALGNSNGRLTAKQVVFVPYGSSADHTDPSYHLPAFYELFSRWAAQDNVLWGEIATESRSFFHNATHPVTGLAPDYSTFAGVPTGSQQKFAYDAWRVSMNIAMDSMWWNVDSWQRDTWIDKYQGFFYGQGVSSYLGVYNVDGTGADKDHSPGLVAMNAVGSMISEDATTWKFVEEFWNTSPTTGTWRYFDGCLYLFGLLNVSGKYQIYGR